MRDQKKSLDYASLVVVGLASVDTVAIEAISITLESCDLSGAWLVNLEDSAMIDNLLSEKIIIFLDGESKTHHAFKKYSEKFIEINDLIEDAKAEINTANKLFNQYVQKNQLEYSEYMKVPPAERKLLPKVIKKNLVPPVFSNWPDSVMLESAENELVQMKKLGAIEGTPNEMKKILAASRFVQFLIYMWKSDEIERVNRVYVLGQDSEQTILPPSWLKRVSKETS
jgi:hypothetical protein